MILDPAGLYPLEVKLDQPPSRAAIQAYQASDDGSSGFFSFSVRPSSVAFTGLP